jgi:hypothetical protein
MEIPLGPPLRAALGAALGAVLGDPLGPALGNALGPELGRELGSALGDAPGPALVEVLNALLSAELGLPLGDELGLLIGELIGLPLGDALETVLGDAGIEDSPSVQQCLFARPGNHSLLPSFCSFCTETALVSFESSTNVQRPVASVSHRIKLHLRHAGMCICIIIISGFRSSIGRRKRCRCILSSSFIC